MKRNTVNGQGYDLHDKPADLFFRHAAETVKKAEDPAAARAYTVSYTHLDVYKRQISSNTEIG